MDEGDGAAEKLSSFLETPVRLFRFISDAEIRHRMPRERITRPVNPEFVYGFETTFTDGFPYLIINEVTLPLSCALFHSSVADVVSEPEKGSRYRIPHRPVRQHCAAYIVQTHLFSCVFVQISAEYHHRRAECVGGRRVETDPDSFPDRS